MLNQRGHQPVFPIDQSEAPSTFDRINEALFKIDVFIGQNLTKIIVKHYIYISQP